ncbi:MAG TPA: MMPL family transporter [Thermoleophilaceae bacterium]|nr:MMPL family transporter [Thermoleophilaceae bacterium]
MALCGLLGLASGDRFEPTNLVAPGTESARWIDLLEDTDFGANVNVLLEGPRRELRRQGEALAAELRASPGVRVVSPYDETPRANARNGKSLRLLRPDSALFVVDVRSAPDAQAADALIPVRRAIAETVSAPVTSRVAGAPALAEGTTDASYSATRQAELISIPVLLIVLLLIFGSPVAAAIPAIMGIGTAVAAGGLIKALATQTPIDQIGPTMASMMALALGVDYSLLLVSRYREHRRTDAAAVSENVEAATRATGRTIAFAAILLITVMLTAAALAVGPIIASAAIGIGIATLFGAASGIVVAPALLQQLDPWLERWQMPWRRTQREPRFARRQPIAIPIIALIALLALAAPTMGLSPGAPDISLLPESSPVRADYEKVAETVGPGYGAVFNVLVQSQDGRPLTADRSLDALTRMQRKLATDPGIVAVLGPAELKGLARQGPAIERSLARQRKGMARLDRGLGRATDGSRAAGEGAASLSDATGDVHRGSTQLAGGIDSAEQGSEQLSGGIGEASDGSAQAAEGSGRASDGAGRLSKELERADEGSANVPYNARLLERDLREGSDQLVALGTPIGTAESSLASAWRAIEAMTTGRADPQFQAAQQAIRAASQALTGNDPGTGEQLDPGYAGVTAGIADAEGQFDLGRYLARRMERQGERSERGVAKLAKAARRLDDGVAELSSANSRLAEGLARLDANGARLPVGLSELAVAADRLTEGFTKVGEGAGRLATGIGAPGDSGLTGGLSRMHRSVSSQRGDSRSNDSLQERSPGLFRSDVLPLAMIDGTRRPLRERTQFVLDTANGGRTAQISAFPAFATSDARVGELRERVGTIAHEFDRPDLEIVVGGPGASFEDYKDEATARLPAMVAAFVLVSLLILIVAVRAIPLAAICVLLNLLTVGVTFGVMQLGFGTDDPLLGGPGFVDILGLGITLAVVFALSIDYQTFLLARIREEYLATGSNERALVAAIGSTARVVTGAAAVMVAIFLAFCISPYVGVREIGVGLAVAVFLDATVVRLVLLPAAMRLVGDDVWWFPRWLDRRLPNVSL